MLTVAQSGASGCQSSALRTPDDPGKTEVRHIAVVSSRGASRLFHFVRYKRLHYRAIDRIRTGDDEALGTLRDVLAIGPHGTTGDFVILQYTSTSSLSVSIFSEAASLRRTLVMDLAPPNVIDLNWHIAGATRGQLWFCADGFVGYRNALGAFLTMSLSQAPTSLHISPLESAEEALISLANEVLLIDAPKAGKPLETVNLYSGQLASNPPVCCYLADRSIVVAHEDGGMIFPRDNRLAPCATLSIPRSAGRPHAICPTTNNGFAILTTTSKLLVFEPESKA